MPCPALEITPRAAFIPGRDGLKYDILKIQTQHFLMEVFYEVPQPGCRCRRDGTPGRRLARSDREDRGRRDRLRWQAACKRRSQTAPQRYSPGFSDQDG